MDGKDEEDGQSTSGEIQSEQVSGEGDNDQKALLEEEIKKIISGLDIKVDDSVTEEEETGTSVTPFVSSYPTQRATGTSSIGTPHRRTYMVETASTMSAATTVVHQRVPPKISVSHVKHEQFGFSSITQGNQTLYSGIGNDSSMLYCVGNDFEQPERDEITEPSCETIPITTDNTTSSSCDPTTSTQQPLARRQQSVHRGSLAPLIEEPIRNFPGHCANATPQPLYDRLMNPTDFSPQPQLPECTSYDRHPVAEPARYTYSSNIFPTDSGYVNQHPPQCYRDQQPHVCRITSNPQITDENVNRYNSAHVTCCTAKEKSEKPKRSRVTDFLLQKSRSFFGRSQPDLSDSGDTVPQLYKACIKKGATPQRFTFKAVSGVQMPYEVYCGPPPPPQPICEVIAPCHCGTAYPQSTTCVLENERHGAPCNQPTTGSVPPVYSNSCYCCKELPRNSYEVCPEKGFQEVFNMRAKHDSARHGGNCNGDSLSKACYPEQGCEGYVSRKSNVPEKVEIYCFDHLNTGFFQTSDHPPPLFADIAIQQTERYATVFWAEVFGMVNVVFAFLIAMVLQTFKFALQGIVRPIMMGFVQLLSDYLIKPFLTLLYNGFTQPISVFLYNVIASIRDVLQPLAKGLGYFVELIAVVLKAIRLVEVRNVTNITPCNPSATHTR